MQIKRNRRSAGKVTCKQGYKYIMQNTMVRGAEWPLGEKIQNEDLREKMKRGKEKLKKIHQIKTLKIHLFW